MPPYSTYIIQQMYKKICGGFSNLAIALDETYKK